MPKPSRKPTNTPATATASAVRPAAFALAGWREWSFVSAAFAALLLILHGPALLWPFVSDDFVFLDASRDVRQLFSSFDVYSNYFRPIGRELYFFAGHLLARNDPFPYHVFNFLVLLAIVVLVVALGRRLGGVRLGLLAGLGYALLYSHHLALAWISCSQDLLAALLGLCAMHALLSKQRWRAGLWHLAAMLAKESVAAFPIVYAIWRALEPAAGKSWRQRMATGLGESAPLWAATAAWGVLVMTARIVRHAWAKGQGTALADVTLSIGGLWEGLRSALLSYFALEQPWDAIVRAFSEPGLPWLVLGAALLVVGAIAWRSRGAEAPGGRAASAFRLGLAWAVVGAFPIALAGHHYSAYYITFSGIGFALCVGALLARAPLGVALVVFAAQTVLGHAADRVDLFNFAKMTPTAGVSFITTTRLDVERRFLDSLHVAMDRVRPSRGSVVYMSHAPHYSTFVTMSGRAPRVWFEDPGLELRPIGDYRGDQVRPHFFLRFVPETRGFVNVPNELMQSYLAAEDAMNARQFARALVDLDRAMQLVADSGPAVVRLDLLNNRGFALSMLGDTAAARASWRQALALQPSFESAALNLARVDASAGRLGAARETLEQLLAHAPNAPDALSMLVRVQQAQGDAAAANATFARLAAADPERAEALRRASAGAPPP